MGAVVSPATLPVLLPDWPVPPGVKALMTTRAGGMSDAPYDTLNLGDHVGDDIGSVTENRRRLVGMLPAEPLWLHQVHGVTVCDADAVQPLREADAIITRRSNVVCAVMTADCLPVLFADRAGTIVGAAHAGWRGLHAGVLEACVRAMQTEPNELLAWLGPAIGPDNFEVGGEVRDAFLRHDPAAAAAFLRGQADRWLADIFLLARQRLVAAGLAPAAIFGGELCTVSDARRWFSYRRDGRTGRMASLIWRAEV